MISTRKTLDPMGCGTPGCGHDHSTLFLHQMCHPHAGLEVSYSKPHGQLTVACNECHAIVTLVQVAEE